MAKKSNYVFPIERNTALEIVKIIKNFYMLEGATGEELLEKRKGLSTQLLLGGLQQDVFTQELLNNIYANLNNEETLISIIKENFQSVDYESALFLLRWTKDSQSPYYPRMQGDKPVEQFNEDYEFAKNLLVAYINDHTLTAIKNLPGRVIRVQKDLIKDMANNFRAEAIDEARKSLTANQESLVELRTSIKEQKQKIADLKAANPDAQTAELEAKLNSDRHLAIEKYKIVKGQRRSLRDTLEEKSIIYRDFAEVVGGKTINKAQTDAEREEFEEKLNLEKKVLDLIKKSTASLQNPATALEIIALNIRGKYNEKEIKELLGEETQEQNFVSNQLDNYENSEQVENINENNVYNSQEITNEINNENSINSQNEVENNSDGTNVNITTENQNTLVNNSVGNENYNQNNINGTNTDENGDNTSNGTDTIDNNGQEMFNSIYNQTLEENNEQEQTTEQAIQTENFETQTQSSAPLYQNVNTQQPIINNQPTDTDTNN